MIWGGKYPAGPRASFLKKIKQTCLKRYVEPEKLETIDALG